jgi:hypothetical protein
MVRENTLTSATCDVCDIEISEDNAYVHEIVVHMYSRKIGDIVYVNPSWAVNDR